MVIDPLQAFLGANVDMNRANEVRPVFRKLADIAQSTGCAIVMIGHLNKASGTQSTYRGLGSIEFAAVVRSILFVGKVKDDPITRVIVHEKSSLAPPGQALAFSLGDQKGFRWIGAYDISAEDLLAGGERTKAELKQEQAMKLIYEFLSDGREISVAELNKEAIERGISERTVRMVRNSIYDTILLCFPIWWYVAPTIINTFLESYNFSGKRIILFATSGGSGFGNTVQELKSSAANAEIIEGKILNRASNDQLKDFV